MLPYLSLLVRLLEIRSESGVKKQLKDPQSHGTTRKGKTLGVVGDGAEGKGLKEATKQWL